MQHLSINSFKISLSLCNFISTYYTEGSELAEILPPIKNYLDVTLTISIIYKIVSKRNISNNIPTQSTRLRLS